MLAIRMWTRDNSGQTVSVPWQSTSPAACLVLDLLSASGGVAEPSHQTTLMAGFSSAQLAFVAARRLQWTLQGLTDGGNSRNIAAALVIFSSQEQLGESIGATLERATTSQILISPGIVELVGPLPGVAFRAADAGWSEMLPATPEAASSEDADQQSLLRLIRALGREDPLASMPQVTAPASAPPSTGQVQALSPSTGTFVSARSDVDAEPEQTGTKKWLIIGGAAAAVVLVVILIAVFSGGHAKTAPPPSPKATTATPAPEPPPPATPETGTKPESVKQISQKPAKPSPSPNKPRAETGGDGKGQAVAAGPCDFTAGEIPRALDRAENYMHAGKLSDAQAVYQRLLGCPPAHQRAAEGLQRVKQRIAAGMTEQ
jgi:hypothetical protein